jgi:mannose-6-phosphate isomerase-like protein (cupin superfamily)
MRITDVNQQQGEVWRTGVTTRMKVSAANSATQLCMFEQWCDPGHGAPNHLHAVEEVLFVREGQADVLDRR